VTRPFPLLRRTLSSHLRGGLLMCVVMFLLGLGMIQAYPSVKDISGLDEILNSPIYRPLFGSNAPDITLLGGYLAIEVFSFLWVFIAPFIVLLGANAVSTEIEDKTIDILLSYPVKRRSVVLGKYIGVMIYLTLAMAVTWLGLVLGMMVIGETIDQARLFYTVLGAYALFTAITSYSLLFSCLFDDSRRALAASFATLFGTYFMNILAGLVDSLDPIRYLSPFNYFDPNEILVKGSTNMGDLLVLLSFSVATILVSVIWFQRKDIHVA
jgi:ABC-2 type transport system permease protein